VVNARDAMPEGGEIILSAHDIGAGMDADTPSRAVEPLFSAHAFEPAAGLDADLLPDFLAASRGGVGPNEADGFYYSGPSLSR
jgi:hypothetical protein